MILIGTSALSAQVVTTLAGSGYWAFGNGQGSAASFNSPRGLAVDNDGNVYVGDSYNHLIRRIDADGNVTTLAGSGFKGQNGAGGFQDGAAASARFDNPRGLAVYGNGTVYVVDHINNRIRQITKSGSGNASTWQVTTLAGSGSFAFRDGQGTAASFAWPTAVAVDGSGTLYVGDNNNNRIRKITAAGNVTTLAGSR
ncbi:MAG: hypothetical protein ACKOLA_01735, partial [Spartobacteria bacterium]